MTKGIWTAANAAAELTKLTVPGILGFYTHFEITEIFALPKGEQSPINFFTILVGEDRPSATVNEPEYLGDRISLKSLPGWKFGIKRYLRPVNDLLTLFNKFEGHGIWDCSGLPLHTGKLAPIAPQFVPPDSIKSVPWNAVLKNNFWNGAYVLEWSDARKSALKPFFEKPARLQELSEKIGKHVPLRIASLSDRLGNIVVQLPATVLMATFGRLNATAEFFVDMAWHPKATARPLRATCDLDFDGMVSGYASHEITAPYTLLPVKAGEGVHQGFVWDDANQIILAATGASAFINTIGLNMYVAVSEPRVFTVPGDETQVPRRVSLTSTNKSTIGGPENPDAAWTRKRMYADETARLLAERLFVQYKPTQGEQDAEHQRALSDIRKLIVKYGEDGAWLWDPFLSAADILETLFYCPYVNADLRALTDGSVPECSGEKITKTVFLARQREILTNLESNFYGLRLEYRAKTGQAGWNFHDRFLIFPRKEEGALVWSLGTSVNSVGKAHHILQRVDDGQRVMDAFVELWDALAQPSNLVWRTP